MKNKVNYHINYIDAYGHHGEVELKAKQITCADDTADLLNELAPIILQNKISTIDEVFECEEEDPYSEYRISEEDL